MDGPNTTWDEWLALRCQTGEPGAFDDLTAAMERPLYYYALKLTRREDAAGDLLQETWLRALRSIRNLKDPAKLRAWLYSVMRGIAVDRFRHDKARSAPRKSTTKTLMILELQAAAEKK